MNLAEMRAYVRGRYASDLTDMEIDEHVNESYRDLSQLFTTDQHDEVTVATVASTADYTVPADTRRVKQVFLTSGGTKNRLRSMRYEALVYPRTTGEPLRWYPVGMTATGTNVRQKIGLDPIPTAGAQTITVQFEPEPTDMTNDSDRPEYVPEEHHHLICYAAVSLACGKQQDYNLAQNWQQRYVTGFNDLMQRLGKVAASNFPDMAKAGGQ